MLINIYYKINPGFFNNRVHFYVFDGEGEKIFLHKDKGIRVYTGILGWFFSLFQKTVEFPIGEGSLSLKVSSLNEWYKNYTGTISNNITLSNIIIELIFKTEFLLPEKLLPIREEPDAELQDK